MESWIVKYTIHRPMDGSWEKGGTAILIAPIWGLYVSPHL